MIHEFINAWYKYQDVLRAKFVAGHPESYKEVVRLVVEMLHDADEVLNKPDPEAIYEECGDDYSGTLVYVIASDCASPSSFWYVKISYGPCSACDLLEQVRNYDDDPPTEDQINSYMTLSLHIIQKLRLMDEDATVTSLGSEFEI